MTELHRNPVFTVGRSYHPFEVFLNLLNQHSIDALGDLRSRPYSRLNPHFNREELKDSLHKEGIVYVFLGDELGARSSDRGCYVNGRVQYDRIAVSGSLQDGLRRVERGLANHKLALMCAEKEPIECHRTILVARYLAARGIEVHHIHADGRLERHEEAVLRFARSLDVRVDEHHLFRSREELIEDAYRMQEDQIAYNLETEDELSQRAAG